MTAYEHSVDDGEKVDIRSPPVKLQVHVLRVVLHLLTTEQGGGGYLHFTMPVICTRSIVDQSNVAPHVMRSKRGILINRKKP